MIGYLLVLASFAIGAYWHWSDLVESRSTRHRLHALEAEQLNKAIGTAVEVPAQGVADTIP